MCSKCAVFEIVKNSWKYVYFHLMSSRKWHFKKYRKRWRDAIDPRDPQNGPSHETSVNVTYSAPKSAKKGSPQGASEGPFYAKTRFGKGLLFGRFSGARFALASTNAVNLSGALDRAFAIKNRWFFGVFAVASGAASKTTAKHLKWLCKASWDQPRPSPSKTLEIIVCFAFTPSKTQEIALCSQAPLRKPL